jgi:hypothetical protein
MRDHIERLKLLLSEAGKLKPKFTEKNGYPYFDTDDPDTLRYIIIMDEIKYLHNKVL